MPARCSALALLAFLALAAQSRANNPAATVAQSEQVLTELVAIPGRRIPTHLLQEAQGIAIIPRVIKIGFVAGVRRGSGVVLIRDAEGAWSLPRFVRLTGGSIGWQAGVQGTDVVLVFRSRRSLDNLARGKFTIGVDAAAAAGPVGRNAAAATDASLQAEVLSWSRSRGLFAGASIDGSVIEMDVAANTAFYGSTDPEAPQIIPVAATRLQSLVMALAAGGDPAAGQAVAAVPAVAAPSAIAPAAATAPATLPSGVLPTSFTEVRVEALRQSLLDESTALSKLLNPEWQTFLAVPTSVRDRKATPSVTELRAAFQRYEQVVKAPEFAALAQRPEFQSTMELLREYLAAVEAAHSSTLQLPPPPAAIDGRR